MSPIARGALVTGATGLVGSHIVDHLLRDGWSVRALVRAPVPELASRGVETVVGDVLDAECFSRAARGAGVIFHTAAAITPRGGWESFRRLNVDGTRNAIDAAKRSGARLLQLSSVAVYGERGRYRTASDSDSAKTNEDTVLGPLPEGAYYARSKRESEALVLGAHANGSIWATAVRPDVIYGTRDRQFVPRIARVLRHGFAPLIGGGRSTLAVVHAANVASGAVGAATSDLSGGRAYNLANDFDLTVRDFFRLAGAGLGVRVHFVPIPLRPAKAVFGAAVAILGAVSGGERSLVTSGSLSFLTRDNPFSSDRARRELGWSPTVRPEDGVPEAFRWWLAHGGPRG